MYKIDKGVPLPGKCTKYPWEQMGIGDSFFVKNGNQARVGASATNAARFGKKFTTRKVDGGVRVWRVA